MLVAPAVARLVFATASPTAGRFFVRLLPAVLYGIALALPLLPVVATLTSVLASFPSPSRPT
jgi:hypothetical protein